MRMPEAGWVTSTDPDSMLRRCRPVIRDHPRKAYLFAVACCSRIWHLLTDQRSRAAVETTARYVEGLVKEDELRSAAEAARAAHAEALRLKGKVGACAEWAAEFTASADARHAAEYASNFAYVAAGDGLQSGPEHTAQSHLIRCVFGLLPFRLVAFNPVWRTSTVVALASQMYESRDFGAMPILADALQDAGCDNEDVLGHCRGPGPHVRGCWVVDLVLGKE
jgi:hypothetical protein